MITYFKSVLDTGKPFHVSLNKAIERIRSGASKDLCERIRAEKDKSERNKIKKSLPAICFSGNFKERNANAIIEHSGFICIDFDGFFDEIEMLKYREFLESDQYSYCVFTSPSGDGLKVLVKIPKEIHNHKNYFLSLEQYYNIPELDTSCKDISRVCYESYDPNIYVNENALLWDKITVEEHKTLDKTASKITIPVTDHNEVIRRLHVWWNKDYGLVPGKRNENVFILAAAYNQYGIQKDNCISELCKLAQADFSESEIITTINSAYKNFDEFGTKIFEDLKAIDTVKSMVKQGIPLQQISQTIKADDEVIKMIADDVDENFWSVNSKGKIEHINHLLKKFLEDNGFFKYAPNGSKNFVFVKIKDNIISNAYDDDIKDFTLDYLYKMDDKSIYNYFAEKTKLFKEDHLSFLGRIEPVIMRDTETEAYLYYKNCIVKVTPDDIQTIDYMDIDNVVWSNARIDRDFVKFSNTDSVYSRFIGSIAAKDDERIQSLETTIGYLLHSYKNPSYSPAVIINDEVISDNPNGGTGKGIFVQAVGKLKRNVIIDGKVDIFSKTFPYQRVQLDTQLLTYDDVRKNFVFENLFPIITEGLTLEKKNKDEVFVPFEDAPKIIITTNYAIKGNSNSFARRKWEIELAQHYHKDYTPADEFGHQLFTDWDTEEWYRFDNYMIKCLQDYLKKGLRKSKFKNLHERKLIADTCFEFYEWAKDPDNKFTKLGYKYNVNDAYNAFVFAYPDFSGRGRYVLPHSRFLGWIEKYGEYSYGKIPDYNPTDSGKFYTYTRKFDEQKEISWEK